MNRLGIFVLGAIFGGAAMFFIGDDIRSESYDNPYGISGLKMLENKGDCITTNNLEIFQTLSDGLALARPIHDYDTFMLLIDESGRLFYDGEKVKNPKNQCARQVGVYTYITAKEIQKTVPAVIMK